MANAVPLISMTLNDEDFAREFGASFERYGFAMIKDHGLDSALVDNAWATAKDYFALSTDEKLIHDARQLGGARGYTPYGTEIAKDAKYVDQKEFWHVGRDLPEGHPLKATTPGNVWPENPDNFRDVFATLFGQFDTLGGRLLRAIAIYLKLDPDFFERASREGNSVLRLLHYPPVDENAPGIRAEAHGDINLITMLLGAEEAGLEIIDKSGEWLPVAPPPGALAVNVGDMLERLTNNRLPSTIHRVRNPDEGRKGTARYSMPFFMHLPSDFLIETLPECVDGEHPNLYPEPLLADDFLQQRLKEIGLKK